MWTLQKERRIQEYIEANLAEPIRISALCAIVELSAEQFNRLFRRRFSTSPYDYVLRQRVELACQLLEESDYPSYRIAVECGFYDGARFAKSFRRITGMVPMEWRKQCNTHGQSLITGVTGAASVTTPNET